MNRCNACHWWLRNAVPEWAARHPERWARVVAKDDPLSWGHCTRQNADRATALMLTDYSSIETHQDFGCVQWEANA